MKHYSEDELILFFYGEARRAVSVQQHIDACPDCSMRYAELASVLKMVPTPSVPERDERYGLEVWQRIRPILPTEARSPGFLFSWWRPLGLAGAFASLLLAAFVAGRAWPTPNTAAENAPGKTNPSAQRAMLVGGPSDRVRTAAIVDHLDESERVLLDFVNAGGQIVDVSGQQAAAADLVEANRLYREAAIGAGDALVADVLDSLERNLIEITHGPSTLSIDDFNKARLRHDAVALLFKVRVLSDELHDQEMSTSPTRRET